MPNNHRTILLLAGLLAACGQAPQTSGPSA